MAKTIHNVLIYEQQTMLQDNSIVAEKGTMGVSTDKKFLEFTLFQWLQVPGKGKSNGYQH